MNKDELVGIAKLTDFLRRKEDDEKKSRLLWILAIIGAVIAVIIIVRCIYKFFAPDYMDDFEDDLEENSKMIL